MLRGLNLVMPRRSVVAACCRFVDDETHFFRGVWKRLKFDPSQISADSDGTITFPFESRRETDLALAAESFTAAVCESFALQSAERVDFMASFASPCPVDSFLGTRLLAVIQPTTPKHGQFTLRFVVKDSVTHRDCCAGSTSFMIAVRKDHNTT